MRISQATFSQGKVDNKYTARIGVKTLGQAHETRDKTKTRKTKETQKLTGHNMNLYKNQR